MLSDSASTQEVTVTCWRTRSALKYSNIITHSKVFCCDDLKSPVVIQGVSWAPLPKRRSLTCLQNAPENDPPIYRHLIGLPLLGFHWANDEISESFCRFMFKSAPLSVAVPCQFSGAHWPPHPHSMHPMTGWALLPHIALGLQHRAWFELRALVDDHQQDGELTLCTDRQRRSVSDLLCWDLFFQKCSPFVSVWSSLFEKWKLITAYWVSHPSSPSSLRPGLFWKRRLCNPELEQRGASGRRPGSGGIVKLDTVWKNTTETDQISCFSINHAVSCYRANTVLFRLSECSFYWLKTFPEQGSVFSREQITGLLKTSLDVWWDLWWKACVCSSQRKLRRHYMSDTHSSTDCMCVGVCTCMCVCVLQDCCWLIESSWLCLKSRLMEKSQRVLSKTLAGSSDASSSSAGNSSRICSLWIWNRNQKPSAGFRMEGLGSVCECACTVCVHMRNWQFLQMASCIPQRPNQHLTAHWQIPERPEVVWWHAHGCRPATSKTLFLMC